jgi:pimeloyl-ACP methyl ester carboxylesterase
VAVTGPGVARQPFEVASGGARLAAERTDGDEPTLVLLHAGVADRRAWRATVDALDGACATVAYDRRGFGDTEAPAEPHDHVDDLAAVLDQASLRRAWLVGNSMGGQLALDAALALPDRVDGLVLIAPAVRGDGGPGFDESQAPAAIRQLWDQYEAAQHASELDLLNHIEAHYWLDGPLEPEHRVAGAPRDLFLEMNARVLAAAPVGEEADRPGAWERLGQVRAPTLVLWGDLDEPWTGDVCRALAAGIPGARARELAGVAHLPGLERPAELAAQLAAFVSGSHAGS